MLPVARTTWILFPDNCRLFDYWCKQIRKLWDKRAKHRGWLNHCIKQANLAMPKKGLQRAS